MQLYHSQKHKQLFLSLSSSPLNLSSEVPQCHRLSQVPVTFLLLRRTSSSSVLWKVRMESILSVSLVLPPLRSSIYLIFWDTMKSRSRKGGKPKSCMSSLPKHQTTSPPLTSVLLGFYLLFEMILPSPADVWLFFIICWPISILKIFGI